jgi:putative PEP-CTERM system histidine kinase
MYANIGLFTYGTAFLAYLLLAFALLLKWRNRSLSLSAILATVITAGWAGIIALATLLEYPPVTLIAAAEVTRNGAWLFLLLAIYGARLKGTKHILGSRRWLPWYMVGQALVVVILFAVPSVGEAAAIPQFLVQAIVYASWVFVSLVGVLLLENIYRNSTDDERWSIKYLCLGLGFLFCYDFFMYAEALLLQQLDPVLWQSRGLAIALTAPLIGIAAARSRDRRRATVQLSRHVVFHTFTLLAAGIYLIFMAVVGYFVNYLGGTWSGVLQITFLSAAGLFLLVLLVSSRMRAMSRVWLSKHFFSYKYDYRREWLEFTQTLVEGGDNTPQAIIQAMSKLANCRAGVLWARTGNDRFELLSHWMVETPHVEEYPALTLWLEETGWIIDVKEWQERPALYSGLEMPKPLADAPGGWLVIPLMLGERLEGLLMMRRIDTSSRLNWEDRDLLKVAGRQAASHLAQYQASEALVELLQFETFNRLSAYVIHDLKNILAQQSLIVSNAARHRHNPAFIDDVIDTVGNSVDRMTRLMEQMRSGSRGGESREVELSGVLREVVAIRTKTLPHPIFVEPETKIWVNADREQLANVCGHIVQNAKEATDKHGRVEVRVHKEGNTAVVEVEDSGTGMSPDFIKSRLFKPFDSTKGLTGMGIGVFESREFTRGIGGDLQVRSQEGVGTTFRIVLPCVRPPIIINAVVEEVACE